MKSLNLEQMEMVQGGGKIGCAISVAGFALSFIGLVTMGPVGGVVGTSIASAVATSAGYAVSTAGLASCFTNL